MGEEGPRDDMGEEGPWDDIPARRDTFSWVHDTTLDRGCRRGGAHRRGQLDADENSRLPAIQRYGEVLLGVVVVHKEGATGGERRSREIEHPHLLPRLLLRFI